MIQRETIRNPLSKATSISIFTGWRGNSAIFAAAVITKKQYCIAVIFSVVVVFYVFPRNPPTAVTVECQIKTNITSNGAPSFSKDLSTALSL
jgi:hypothetical protein